MKYIILNVTEKRFWNYIMLHQFIRLFLKIVFYGLILIFNSCCILHHCQQSNRLLPLLKYSFISFIRTQSHHNCRQCYHTKNKYLSLIHTQSYTDTQ